jgi:hypothetical protein
MHSCEGLVLDSVKLTLRLERERRKMLVISERAGRNRFNCRSIEGDNGRALGKSTSSVRRVIYEETHRISGSHVCPVEVIIN